MMLGAGPAAPGAGFDTLVCRESGRAGAFCRAGCGRNCDVVKTVVVDDDCEFFLFSGGLGAIRVTPPKLVGCPQLLAGDLGGQPAKASGFGDRGHER